MGVTSATLAPPTGVGAVNGVCVPLTSREVALSWTASTSGFRDGYEIFRSTTSGGPYTSIGTALAAAVLYTDAAVAASTTYYYVIQSTKIAWRSANTAQVSVTTPSVACV